MDTIQVKWPQAGTTITTTSGIVYTIGQSINQGAYALVYEGTDSFGNPVALKIFKPANRPFDEVQKHWESEKYLFQKLRHPNIVAIYDSFVCENLFYIVLEKAWGNLEQFVKSVGTLNEFTVKEIARQLLFGLHGVHRAGVLQRDLTIYNILVFEGPQSRGPIYKISDFGISEEFVGNWNVKLSTSQIAHPLFKPPELLNYGFTNEQSDLYHLGLVLLYSLTGKLPFSDSMTEQEITKMVNDGVARQIAENIKTPFGDFVSILLRRRQEYRFKTALDAWNCLRKL
jgi:serine/threonine-protein kinase